MMMMIITYFEMTEVGGELNSNSKVMLIFLSVLVEEVGKLLGWCFGSLRELMIVEVGSEVGCDWDYYSFMRR
jgi:hypothetical protein